MKARKIVIFIFGVLAALAVVCAIFPEDGITIGNIHFEFPTLDEILTVDNEPNSQNPEELLAQQLKATSTTDDSEFKKFTESNPARFYVPGNDITYFDGLFDAMENAKSEPMRVLHYGDSQLEGDRISAELREKFQTAFGGSGVGMVPAIQSVGAMTVVQSASRKLPTYFSYPMGEQLRNGRYGIMSQVAHLNGSVQLTYRASTLEGVPHSKTYSKVTMVCSGKGKATLTANGTSMPMTDPAGTNEGVKFLTATLPSPANKVSIGANGNMEIFAVLLDGTNGIAVDNVPMRGCSGTVFAYVTDRKTLEPFFKRNKVGLLILQYGGNSVPYLKSEKRMREYKESLIAQIELFKAMSPETKILFIGPADMSANVKGKKETYPQLEPTISMIKDVCSETGVAFWNLYDAMGGHNSMIQWVKAGLAGKDYVHFTRDGASEVADMLFNTFLMYYHFYCKREGKTPKDFH
jgi:lysophospholipase L1-like esterase